MDTHPINIAVLTSSRADYGYYRPVLLALNEDSRFNLTIIAFGTHTDSNFGETYKSIEADGLTVNVKIKTPFSGDEPLDIVNTFAKTVEQFGEFWQKNRDFKWVLCLGDRFEMAAAVVAGLPFGIRYAHFYGGDKTLGAIDNVFRDQITHCSSLHFVALPESAERVKELTSSEKIEVVGSLSLLNLKEIELLNRKTFCEKWGLNEENPFILVTAHPETVAFEQNQYFAEELFLALREISAVHQILVTLPNADTNGTMFREMFRKLKEGNDKVITIENLGTQSYFSAIELSELMLGNTSSGILESAYFKKFVINLGDRQKGRTANENVVNIPFNHQLIVANYLKFVGKTYEGKDRYKPKNAVSKILNLLCNE